jgi:hypothetical protein
MSIFRLALSGGGWRRAGPALGGASCATCCGRLSPLSLSRTRRASGTATSNPAISSWHHYHTTTMQRVALATLLVARGRGLHSSTFQLNL